MKFLKDKNNGTRVRRKTWGAPRALENGNPKLAHVTARLSFSPLESSACVQAHLNIPRIFVSFMCLMHACILFVVYIKTPPHLVYLKFKLEYIGQNIQFNCEWQPLNCCAHRLGHYNSLLLLFLLRLLNVYGTAIKAGPVWVDIVS